MAHAGPRVVAAHHALHPASLRSQPENLRWCEASDSRTSFCNGGQICGFIVTSPMARIKC